MRAAWALALLVLLAGCSHGPARPEPLPGDYLVDDRGDAPPRFDVVRANFTELNGSLAVRITIRNYADGLPFLDAFLETSRGPHYVSVVPAPERTTTPQAKAVSGRLVDGQRVDEYETCWLPNFPTDPESEEPWWIFLELLHARTGLDQGGTIHALEVRTHDQNGTEHDQAEHQGDAHVAGGANPYEDRQPPCPMYHERGRLY